MEAHSQGSMLCQLGQAQGPSGNQAASLKQAAEVEPSELFAFKECQDLFRTRLREPLLRIISQLTGLRLHVLWHRPLDFQGPGEMPVLCPRARQRAGAKGRQPKSAVLLAAALEARLVPGQPRPAVHRGVWRHQLLCLPSGGQGLPAHAGLAGEGGVSVLPHPTGSATGETPVPVARNPFRPPPSITRRRWRV